jgi:uncharacterized protein (DUF4415 family)
MFLDFNKEIKRIHNEYGAYLRNVVNTPNSVYRFCVSGYPYLVRGICNRYVPVSHVNAVTGYTDGKTIYVPKSWFYDKFYSETFKIDIDKNDLPYVMVGMYDGLLIHEALHILLTGFDLDKKAEIFNELNEKYGKNYSFKNEFIRSLFNIVEDIYIEQWLKRNNPYYYQKLLFMDSVIFHEEDFASRVESFESGEDFISAFTNLLITYKMDYYHEALENLIPEATAILQKLLGDLTDLERHEVVYQLIELMPEQAEQQAEGSGEGVAEKLEQMCEGSGTPTESIQYTDYEGNTITQEQIEAIGKAHDKLIDENGGKVAHELKQLEDGVREEHSHKTAEIVFKEQIKRYKVNGDKQTTVTIYKPSGNDNRGRFKIDRDVVDDFRNVGKEFLKIKAREKNTSPPINKGRIKSGLISKIAITDNIMRQRTTSTRQFVKPEVIILADISGSTVSTGRGMGNLTLLEFINNAAFGMFEALKSNGVSCAVYAHTTVRSSECAILPVVANNHFLLTDNHGGKSSQNTNDTYGAFMNVLDFGHGGNADPVAIWFLNKYGFTDNGNSTKILIHLSDGEPSDSSASIVPSHRKHDALDELTKELVNSIREEKNHYVFSVSVTKHVIESNNYIYSPQFNINASNPKDYSSFQGLVERIIFG